MCLITEQNKPKFADKDIKVVKAFAKVGVKIYSPFQRYEASTNKLDIVDRIKTTNTGFYPVFDIVEERYLNVNYPDWIDGLLKGAGLTAVITGFHSLHKTGENIDRLIRISSYNRIIQVRECIIPKGSEIWENATGGIVSNKIIVTNIILKEIIKRG